MKIRLLYLFIIGLFSVSVSAQKASRNICIHQHALTSWSHVSAQPAAYAADAPGQEIIQEIIDVLGLKPNFDVRAANVPNAAAVVYGGKRFILYNPTFIGNLVRASGNNWAAISVLAHEIGHHLNGHTLMNSGSHPGVELEADEFSGFVLRKMGASLRDAQAAMRLAADQRASSTHPAQMDRLSAIAKGWQNADNQASGRNNTARVAPPAARPAERPVQQLPQAAPRQVALAGQQIVSDVYFNADKQSSYYVTNRFNLVKMTNNRPEVIGRLAPLKNSAGYPFMIYDQNTRFLVDNEGNIFTTNGRRIGFMNVRKSGNAYR